MPEYVLELQDVSKTYGSGHTAVQANKHIDLRVAAGETVLIMGPSGSGKTTLLSIAGLLLSPTEGSVYVLGRETTRLSHAHRAHARLNSLGFVFQSYNLMESLTAEENVELVMNLAGVRGPRAVERARGLLESLGMGGRAHHTPADLSGGEKQRVAIARALANDPPLILADEPTGNLDSKTGQEVMDLLCGGLERNRGRAMVIVTHDHRLREHADRVLWLEDGQLSETDGQYLAEPDHRARAGGELTKPVG